MNLIRSQQIKSSEDSYNLLRDPRKKKKKERDQQNSSADRQSAEKGMKQNH